jgi:hypothetical protein
MHNLFETVVGAAVEGGQTPSAEARCELCFIRVYGPRLF